MSRLLLLALAFTLGLAASATASEPGFEPIFNGRDLTGWDGNPAYWTVQNGAIRGETTLSHPAFTNSFLIWRGGKPGDFELRLDFRIQSGNSGVQYRSKDLGKWRVSGYQAEVENNQGKVGFLYEERGRKFLANVGESVRMLNGGKKVLTGPITPVDDFIQKRYYRDQSWNEYRIVCVGPRITQYLNGFQTVELVDEDPDHRALEGIIALQLHAGPPMQVEFREIRLKKL